MTASDPGNRPMSRRGFLRWSALAMVAVGALLAGCRPSAKDETASAGSISAGSQAAASATPVAQQTTIPTRAAATSAPAATATPAAQPTSIPTRAVPTSTPAAQLTGVACPVGRVNDPFPGRCKLYRDLDGDGYCDLSKLGSGTNVVREGDSAPDSRRPRR